MRIKPVTRYTRMLLAIYHQPDTASGLCKRLNVDAGDLSVLLQRARVCGAISDSGGYPAVWSPVTGVFDTTMRDQGAIS